MEFKDVSALIKTPLDKVLSFVGEELKQVIGNRILEYQAEEYKRNYFAKTILHRAEPKKLEEFYIPLRIRKHEKKSYSSRRTATDSITKLFSRNKYITLIGSAGSGKSTLVKYLFVNSIQESFKVPIKVELRYLNEHKEGLTNYIFEEIFKYQKLGISTNIIERLLDSGNFVFFLDGYDELNSSIKEHTTNEIDRFISRFGRNNYLITSRPYTNIDLLPLFTNFEVCDLEENEIAAFVKKQLPIEEKEVAEKIIKTINKEENKSYRSFLSNPLLLSMFILTFQSYANIPQKRSEFYDQVFDTLFSVHDSMSKLAYVREKQSGLSKEQFVEILRLFSFLSFFDEKFLFPRNYLEEKLLLIKDKKKNIHFDNAKFVTDLQIAIGILNLEGLDYTFPHRSLQEYFAASYIQHLSIENKKIIYSKLRTEINTGVNALLLKEHFFSLLVEMDTHHAISEVAVPVLNDVVDVLNSVDNISRQQAYKLYGRVILINYIFLNVHTLEEITHKDILLCEGERPRYVFFRGGRKDDIEMPDPNMFKDELEIEKVVKVMQQFKEKGGDFVKEIQSNLDRLNKSDEAIIKMI